MKPKYKVHLCKKCIEQLDEDYSYLIPRDQLEIIEVPMAECDNEDLDNYNQKLRERNPAWEASDEKLPRACEALGFCPFTNSIEGFPCPGCPYEKDGGYHED